MGGPGTGGGGIVLTRRIVALVQARMGSTRFPGKMMADLAGYPVLRWVLERARRARRLDQVVLVTTTAARDDELVTLADGMGIEIHRGSEADVLGRMAEAARQAGAGTVVRVCADNPLIDGAVVDAAIDDFLAGGADYVFNHTPKGGSRCADGLGAEVLAAPLLDEIDRIADTDHQREHVTAYIWDNQERFTVRAVDCPPDWDPRSDAIRLDVDRPEDLDHLRQVCAGLDFGAPAATILARWRAVAREAAPV